jgi:hypothetical protein
MTNYPEGMRSNWVIAVTLLSMLLSARTYGADQLQSRKLLDGKVTMLIPTGFGFLAESKKREKYPGANAPAHVLSNLDGTVNIAFDHKRAAMKAEEVSKLEDPMRAQFSGLKIHSGGVRKLNGVEFLVFDMETPAPDGNIRNVMAFTSLEGRLLVVSYNCQPSRDLECGALGNKLIDSIVLAPGGK